MTYYDYENCGVKDCEWYGTGTCKLCIPQGNGWCPKGRETKFIEDEDGNWECDNCHEIWVLIEGTPEENNYKYCPNCGWKIGEYVRYRG